METLEPSRQYETDLDLASYGLYSPLSPQTPPVSSPSPYQESYKRTNNPLFDLIETEQKYVEDLKRLLQQVTACWSSDNLPPSDLDLMFRKIEAVYKINKKFYFKLNKIGSNTAPENDFNGTLLTWVNDMVGPYTKYVEVFKLGIDSMPEIEENLILQQTLNDISAEKNQPISLDYFFDMPLKRLHYYKKLYTRLCKITEPGRSDNDLFLSAIEQFDHLLEMEKEIKNSNKTKEEVFSSAVISPAAEDVSPVIISPIVQEHEVYDNVTEFSLINPQNINSLADSNTAELTDDVQFVKKYWTLEELESQLDTSRTKDLFTKLPKIINFSLCSQSKREIILHDNFIIETTKSINSVETIHISVHIFLLTDILLICQQITQEEKQEFLLEKDLTLTFPPLNLNHLAIKDVSDEHEDSLELTILQKEMIILYANDKDTKDHWLREVTKAIKFSSNAVDVPQLNTDLRTIRKSKSEISPRLSTHNTTLSASNDTLKRSPSIGNLINNSSRPMSSVSKTLSLFPDVPIITRSLTPDPPQNAGGKYPGDYLPSQQGMGERHNSDPMLSPGLRNKLTVGLQTGRSNSITSIASVMSIATFRETIFRSSACEVFTWADGRWKLLTTKDKCIVEIRLTVQNSGCWAVLLESSNKMVLNAWIHPTTTLHREDANSVSISCETGQRKEFYKISISDSAESDKFLDNLLEIKKSARESKAPTEGHISRSSSLFKVEPLREVEQTVTQVMEGRCRVFLQNDHGVWTNLGWGNMKLLLETPSHRKRIIVNSDKKSRTIISAIVREDGAEKIKTIIDAIVREDGVERIGKSVAVTLNNMGNNIRIVYLLKMKDEASAVKLFDIVKEKRKNESSFK